jgi:hypothetical protein
MSDLRIAQVVYNADTQSIEFRVPLADGTGDHVLATVVAVAPPAVDAATLPATPPVDEQPEAPVVPVESFLSVDSEETVYGTPEGF